MAVKPKPWRYESRRARKEREQSEFLKFAWDRMNATIRQADPVVYRSPGYTGEVPGARERRTPSLPRARDQRGLLGYPEAVRDAARRQRERDSGGDGGGGGGGFLGAVKNVAGDIGGGIRDVGEAALGGAKNIAEQAEDLRRGIAGSLPGPGGPGGGRFLQEHGTEVLDAATSFEAAASYIPGVSREDVRRGIRRAIPGDTVLDDAALFAARNLGPIDVAAAAAGPAIGAGLRAAGGTGRITGAGARAAAGLAEPVASGGLLRRLGGEAALGLGAGAGAEGVGRALPEDTPAGLRVAAQLGAGLVGAGITSGAYRNVPGAAPPRRNVVDSAPKPAREYLFGLPERVEQRLQATPESLADRIANVPKSIARTVTRSDPLVDPIFKPRQNAARIAESQATYVAEAVRVTERRFKTDATGRIVDLPGRPTLQDLAANLPRYEQDLTPKQLESLGRLRGILEPFGQAVREEGIEIGYRPDVIEGGFYVPRGHAEPTPSVQQPTVGTGRRGGKRGFERPAEFRSMVEGIESGYKYEPSHVAAANYVRDVQQRVTDEWTARRIKELTDDLGNPLGESLADRRNPELRGRVAALRSRVAGLRETLGRQTVRGKAQQTAVERLGRLEQELESRGRATAGERALIDDVIDSNTDELIAKVDGELKAIGDALGLTERARGAAQARAQATSTRALETQNRWLQLKSELDNVKLEWEQEKLRTATMPRGTGGVDVPGLQGWSFPATVADAINRRMAKEGKLRGSGADPLLAIRTVNGLLRGLNAMGDLSALGIQGLLGLAADPVGYGRALALSLESVVDPRVLGKYLEDYDAKAARFGRPTAAEHIAHGLRLGGDQTEYTIGARGAGRAVEKLGRAPILRESNRQFGYFTDILRLELADAQAELALARGQQLTDKDLSDIAHGANIMTGWAPNRFGGDWGDLALFAPRFFQSQLEVIAKSVADGSMTGEMARRSLLRYLGLSTLFVAAANEALGNENFDWKSFIKNGHTNPNWLRIRTPFGVDVSLLGPWDSLAKGVAGSVLERDPRDFFRGKSSPLVSLSWDVITGKTYIGKDVNAETLFRRLLPFSASEVGDESLPSTLIGLTGAKAPDITPAERLDAEAYRRYGVESFWDLTGVQRNIIKQELPELWAASVDRKREASQEWEEVKTDINQRQEVVDQAFLAGELKKNEWLDKYHELEDERRVLRDRIFPDEGGKPKDVVDRYFAEWSRLEAQSGGLGMTDEAWDELDAYREQLSPEDQERINAELGVGRTGLVQVYRATAPIRNAYWDLPKYRNYTADEARQIDDLLAEARAAAGPTGRANPGTMLKMIKQLGDKYPEAVVSGARKAVIGILSEDKARERYKREHPEVALFDSFSREPLTPDDIALIEEWLAKPEVQERIAPR